MESKKQYWDWRFKKGSIYGLTASSIMFKVYRYFAESKKVIVIGGGYGRNAAFLAEKNFFVTTTDISRVAIDLGKKVFRKIKNLEFSILDISKERMRVNQKYDSLLCIYILNLFREKELEVVFKNLKKLSNNKGYIIFNFLSTSDEECGNGQKIGENKFLFHKKQYIKFYSKKEVVDCVEKNKLILIKVFEVKEKRFITILKREVLSSSWVVIAKK